MTDKPLISNQIDEIAKALAALQAEIPNPPKTFTKGAPYPYAKLDDCLDIAKKYLHKHSLAFSQLAFRNSDGTHSLVTVLLHTSGQWLASFVPIESVNVTTREGKLKNNPMQAYGSGTTYARRIGLLSVLGLVGEEDDDAESLSTPYEAAPAVRTSFVDYSEQLQKFKKLCKDNNVSIPDFCERHNVRTGDPESIRNAIENFFELKKQLEIKKGDQDNG